MRGFRDGGVGDGLHCCCKLAFYCLFFTHKDFMIAMMSLLLSFAISSIHLILVLYRQRCFVDAEADIESPALLLVIYMHKEKEP